MHGESHAPLFMGCIFVMLYKTPKAIDWTMLNQMFSGSGLFVQNSNFDAVLRVGSHRLVYLATPYSKEVLDYTGKWCAARSEILGQEAAKWMGHLALNGVSCVSPIVQSVAMVSVDNNMNIDPLDDMFWEKWCRPLLNRSDVVIIPPIDGWDRSYGVWREAWSALSCNNLVIQMSGGL